MFLTFAFKEEHDYTTTTTLPYIITVDICVLHVPFVARMTAMYCWLKVLTVSSMAGLWEVTKLKATSSLALLSVEEVEA